MACGMLDVADSYPVSTGGNNWVCFVFVCLILRIMRPDDANIVGNVHGGTILKIIEEAGCIIGTRHCNTQTGVSYAPMHITVI